MWPSLQSQKAETPAPVRNEQPARIIREQEEIKEYSPIESEISSSQEGYQDVEYELDELPLEDNNIIQDNASIEYENTEVGESDLVDEILKEIKNEKND